jgi:hypothetical protein
VREKYQKRSGLFSRAPSKNSHAKSINENPIRPSAELSPCIFAV